MALVSGFFIVPEVGAGTEDDPQRPKYVDDSRVVKWYGGEAISHATGDYHAVRVFVDDADDVALDQLEQQSDAFRIYPAAVENALNATNMLPVDISARDWALMFSKFLTE
ncbi:hypothetical protein [Halobellus limi]|uniref:Uncharacterized protein n=1 Tax=Halobellus limi TaxID=699433 RepID=A0A1H5ZGV5_9EURY|nr:hypothetical protein [Halobellus limi]QCC48102.1 hypothetical protein DV707_10760 [Halobellus limi]SEG35491.1 hypothetical protein SAMN04488133_1992 [Halobellus limi]